MTIYSCSFLLEGEEVLTYRRMLELWAATANEATRELIHRLIQRTFDASGKDAVSVEERIRLDVIFPLCKIMSSEFKRTAELRNASWEVPREDRDVSLDRQLNVLQRVIDKVISTQMSSTYYPGKP